MTRVRSFSRSAHHQQTWTETSEPVSVALLANRDQSRTPASLNLQGPAAWRTQQNGPKHLVEMQPLLISNCSCCELACHNDWGSLQDRKVVLEHSRGDRRY